ncbi:MAG TPA: efflux RND transporter permease subunit [Nocardioidaceae bacterium]|nr:efflux RND transporter permease subunit [Nocardioidaceae bacterium]
MVSWVVGASMRNRVVVLAVAAGLVVFGALSLRETPVDVVPEMSPTQVEIQTEALGLSAEEVEQLITVPLEADLLNGVAFLDDLRSTSMPGLSSILLTFEPGTDMLSARQVVQEQMTQAHALPNVSKPPVMLQPVSSTSRVMMATLSSDSVSAIDMSVLARWEIRPRLMAVTGVANVSVWGQKDRQLQVLVDPDQLIARDVTLLDVVSTAGNALAVSPLTFLEASTPGTGGFVDTPNQRLGIQHILPINNAADLSRVTVEGKPASGLRLGDVSQVVEDHQPLIGDAVVNDGVGLMIVIEKFPDANTLEVTNDLEKAFEEMGPGLAGIDVDTGVYRPASYIDSSIDNVALALIIGLLLLGLVIGGFLYQWRAALISLISVPTALLAAAAVLYQQGVTFNTMILAGLVVGLCVIVDDAIVDVDALVRRLREKRAADAGETRHSLILAVVSEVRSSMAFATVVIFAATAPLLFVRGTPHAFFEPLALSYALAVGVSMVVALTLTPAMTVLLLGRGASLREAAAPMRYLEARYAGALRDGVARPLVAYVGLAAAAVVAVGVLPAVSASLTPSFRERQLLVAWTGPPGTSQPEMARITSRATEELRALPGVSEVGAHFGRALLSDAVVDVNSGEIWVTIDDGADYDSTVADVTDVVGGYPGMSTSVDTYLNGPAQDHELAEPDRDLVVRLFGADMDVLEAKAGEVEGILRGIEGVSDPAVERQVEEPSVIVEVDLAKAQRYGIKPGEVRRAAGIYMNGLEVGSLYEDAKVFEVVVRGTPETRAAPTSVEDLMINTPSGGHVRLGDVATVSVEPVPVAVEHRDVSRTLDVTADVSGRGIGSVVDDVRVDLTQIDFPLEYRAQVIDGSADEPNPAQRIVLIGLAALIAVYFLLQACFRSWRLAALLLLCLPVALAGGLLTGLIAGQAMTIGAFAGFLALFGIAVRHGILLIRRYQSLETEGRPLDADLVVRASTERLGPILAATLAIGLALLPIVVIGGEPGLEILRPLALVVLGGLVTTALTTLLVVPTLYLRFAAGTTTTSGRAR